MVASRVAARFVWVVTSAPGTGRELPRKCMLALDSGKHGARLQGAEPVGLVGAKPDPNP